MSKTACIIPWTSLAIRPDGMANFCCDIPDILTVGDRPGSIYRDSLHDLWNATEIVKVRSAMARGEKPGACRICWEREAAGGVSRRLIMNDAFRRGEGRLPIELPIEGTATGYRLTRSPDCLILELGNICNLKCRSCDGLFSSRIVGDHVHEAWNPIGRTPSSLTTQTVSRRLPVLDENTSAWFENIEATVDMIDQGATGSSNLALIGGEPFIINHTWRLLSALVTRGVAARLHVGLLTNGQQTSAKLLQLLPSFRGFSISVSIDGYGRLYEYLRHGASWSKLVDNLMWFCELPNVGVTAIPSLQNANALDMVTLLRFLDERKIKVDYNIVNWPARLNPTNLPPSVRRIAAMRLRHYLDSECRDENLAVVRGYCEVLEEAGDVFNPTLFEEFMTFTNDLDADREESIREAAPELVPLVRAAGIEWSEERRHTQLPAVRSPFRRSELLSRVNRTVVSPDAIFDGWESAYPGLYFISGLDQLAEIDERLRECGHAGLDGMRAIADFACNYGRMTRALRAALPHAAIYACDIDGDAVRFCADHLGALPVLTGWKPDEDRLPTDLDAIVCVSLLTHTPLEHWRRALRAWKRMLRPGGIAAFTFLSDSQVDAWMGGEMDHYGDYSREQHEATVRSVCERGFGFVALPSSYGGERFYGITFGKRDFVRREIAAAGLEILMITDEVSPTFAQDLALVRKPDEQIAPRVTPPAVVRDVSLVAFYDPRCYAPVEVTRESYADSIWARLAATNPPRPLPTDLGFADTRVPEVREAQASLAGEHGVDAFCYLYFWGAAGPRWDAPLRDLLTTGRPDFPFTLMVTVENDEPVSVDAAVRLFDDVVPSLCDRRYLRIDNRPILIVRDVGQFSEPRLIAAEWRSAAAARGLGELHLCAMEPVPADLPEDLGFDSLLQTPSPANHQDGVIASALARPWPHHRFFRSVECRRDGAMHSIEMYEHWLRSAIDATRSHGESLVFVNGWNDWLGRCYLEPDDQDGQAALAATRRATRGPSSGLVLLRRLRETLGKIEGPAAEMLGELEQVLSLHERARDRLLTSVEAALGRNFTVSPSLHWVPVASRQLPPSGGGFCLDCVGELVGSELNDARKPILLCGGKVRLAGWAYPGDGNATSRRGRGKADRGFFSSRKATPTPRAPREADLFLALESSNGAEDHIFRISERVARPDVAAVFSACPLKCGFDIIVDLSGVRAGIYRIAIVQRTPHAAYRDATSVTVKLDRGTCSSR